MLITKDHLLQHELLDEELEYLRANSCHELAWNKTYKSLVLRSALPVESKDLGDLSVRDICFKYYGDGLFRAHYEKYFIVQTAINFLRILEGKQIISCVHQAYDRNGKTSLYSINNKIVLQLDWQFFSFIENLMNDKKNFWTCITMFNNFLSQKVPVEIGLTYYLHDCPRYTEAIVSGFPTSRLGMEYLLRGEEDDSVVTNEDLIHILRSRPMDTQTLNKIRAIINGK